MPPPPWSRLGQAKAKGKREYSSIIRRMYLFLEIDANGPLKSKLNLSRGVSGFNEMTFATSVIIWFVFCAYRARGYNLLYAISRKRKVLRTDKRGKIWSCQGGKMGEWRYNRLSLLMTE